MMKIYVGIQINKRIIKNKICHVVVTMSAEAYLGKAEAWHGRSSGKLRSPEQQNI